MHFFHRKNLFLQPCDFPTALPYMQQELKKSEFEAASNRNASVIQKENGLGPFST